MDVYTLGPMQHDLQWRSSLNDALYRWDPSTDGWQVSTVVADWHPVKPGRVTEVVYAQAGERFVAQ